MGMGKQSIGKIIYPPITCYNLCICIYLPSTCIYLLPIYELVYVPGIGNVRRIEEQKGREIWLLAGPSGGK